MKISTRGRYALRMMADIALNSNGGFVSLRDIAERQDISPKYLEQITGQLVKAGFLKSGRGAQGGYRLAREPKDYTLGEILRLTEGSFAPVACLEDENNQCLRCAGCLTLDFWRGLYKTVDDYIDSYTLADLLK